MTLQKITLSMVATVASLALTPAVQADTHVAISGFGAMIGTSHAGIGVWIGKSAPDRHIPRALSHREYGRNWRPRAVRVGPPVVVVRPPVMVDPAAPVVVQRPPVIVNPAPPVVVEQAPPVIEDSTVTVWITNSNGSKTSVELTKHGGWYIGPRGEYYDQMPTNEQLRAVYGF